MPSTVTVCRDSNGFLESITVVGHAGIMRSGEGYEVCIALSTLVQSMYKALTYMINKAVFKSVTDDALFRFYVIGLSNLTTDDMNAYKIVSDGYLFGIKSLVKEYPEYIKYKEEY